MYNWVNVLDYGADPTGVADSSAAFYDAQQASNTIMVPSGTYLKNTETAILNNKTWFFAGATIKHQSDAATLFSATDVSDWSFLGNVKLQGLLTGEANTGECGLSITNPRRAYIQRVTASLFKGSAIRIQGANTGTYRGDQLTIDSLASYENYEALRVNAGSGAEYVRINSVEMVGNIYSAIIAAGNTQIGGGNIVDNYYGPWLTGGPNHGHGGFHGVNINHNTHWNLKAESVTNGYVFNGCHFYGDGLTAGKIILNNSSGVSINNGIVDAVIEISGAGRNTMQGNFIAGPNAAVGGANPTSLLRSGNYTSAGLWSGNTF